MSLYAKGGTTALNYGYALFTGIIVLHLLKRGMVWLGHSNVGSTFLRHSIQFDGRPPADKINDFDFKKRKHLFVPKDGDSRWAFVAQMYDVPYSKESRTRLIDWLIKTKPRCITFTIDITQPIRPQVNYFKFLTDCIFFPDKAHKQYPYVIDALPQQWKFLNHKYKPNKLAIVVNKSDALGDAHVDKIMNELTMIPYEHTVKGLHYDLLSIWGIHKVEVTSHNNKPYFRTKIDSGRLINKIDLMKFVNPN